MRIATELDIEYVAQCLVNIALYLKSMASDIYIDGLPSSVDENTLNIAASYIGNEEAIALIYEKDGRAIACLAGKIQNTSFPPSGVGRIGNIAICWVSENYRNQTIASQLVDEAEKWFTRKGVTVIELSYLAQNSVAEKSWKNLGYSPFRVFSHKVLET